jgi:Domain of Unknown Function with PDB structure (DUF3857)
MQRMTRLRVYIPMLLAAFSSSLPSARASDWLPINSDELQMRSEPLAPLAPAICLYRQIDRSDSQGYEHIYVRIKILTEEGRKYANQQIRFQKDQEYIRSVEARTIHPDGTIANFDGKTYESPIVEGRSDGYEQLNFAMPDAEVGSIVEYRFTRLFNRGNFGRSRWLLSTDLFTKTAKFSLEPTGGFTLRMDWPSGLPPGSEQPKVVRGEFVLESHDIPAFVTEEHMPPENELRYRVDFIYLGGGYTEKDPAKFWQFVGKTQYHSYSNFMDNTSAMEQAVKQIVAPGDAAEVKLQKIYARVQQLRNLSFELPLSKDEQEHQNLRPPENVKQVWERGYAYSGGIDLLFAALARAAGLSADPIYAAARDQYFFNTNAMNPTGLNYVMVLVTLDGKDLYLDPGNPYAPFGQLPWYETAVQALRPTKDGGIWVDTKIPAPADARTQRTATLSLEPNGRLHGQLTVTYSGMEAIWRRATERIEDEEAKRKFLVDQIKGMIPVGAEVELTNQPVWSGADPDLVAKFDVRVDGWGERAGNRMLVPVGLFGGEERHTFEHAQRVHPVYFQFPYEQHDDITITLPEGMHVEAVPDAEQVGSKTTGYQLRLEQVAGGVKVHRDLTIGMLLVKLPNYEGLRHLYQSIRAGDEQQIVLDQGVAPATAGAH